jgi:phosphoenolpyruvate carboxykinase (ATP)
MGEKTMQEFSPIPHSSLGLDRQGLSNLKAAYWNLPTPALYEEALKRNEGIMAHLGPLVVRTGQFTGRSPNDKFVVDEPSSRDKIWWGSVNRPIAADRFEELHRRMASYLQGKDVFVQDCWCGADPDYRMPVRVITQYAWHSLFVRNMFIQSKPEELATHAPEFVVIDCPGFHAFPEIDRTHSDVFILVHFGKRMVLVGGTEYAGEMKKSVFTAMTYFLPFKDVMPMHCSANVGAGGDVALFFGLSGTGKTTLSADPARTLIGDDEHGWSANGIFNFEGGCYAKVIHLSAQAEPEIYDTTRRYGTILENVGIDMGTRRLDLNDGTLTENTRAAYPIAHIPHASRDGRAGHPSHILFLTADAFGVLPPLAKLTPEQAMYHFLSGYTAKVAGTERGIVEPKATFSACFGAPFMAQHPRVYAEMLGRKIAQHGVTCWLVNTGWTGGSYGAGSRMKIAHTRAMITAALAGKLDEVPFVPDPVFGVLVPLSCPGVPSEVLAPRGTWPDPAAYDAQASLLADLFRKNFQQFDGVTAAVRDSGPTAR